MSDASNTGTLPSASRSDSPPASRSGYRSGYRSGSHQAPIDLTTATIVLLAVLAAILSLVELLRPSMLFGVTEYDDAVYLGSAVRLIHGAIPYRDFWLVQPPGLMLLLTPFAWLADAIGTRDTLGVARLFMPLVAGAQVLLVGKLVRYKGQAATFAGCAAMALYTDAITSTHTIVLEPLLDLCCLGALAFAFEDGRLRTDRRILYAGVVFGVGGAIKLFAIIPVLAVVVVCAVVGRRTLFRLIAGCAIGFGALVAPFFALDPTQFIRQVVLVQLHRQLPQRTPLQLRFSHLLGLSGFSSNFIGTTASAARIVIVGVLLLLLVAGGYLLLLRRRRVSGDGPTQLDYLALATTVVVGVVLLFPAEFYYHYADFIAPFLALTVATSVAGIAGALGSSSSRRSAGGGIPADAERAATAEQLRRSAGRVFGIISAVLVAAAGAGQMFASSVLAGGNPVPAVDSIVPAGACTISDSPAELVSSDRLVSNVPGCPDIVDALGVSLTIDDGKSPAIFSTVTPALIETWERLIGAADYIVLTDAYDLRIPLVPVISADLADHFRIYRENGLDVLVRRGFPVASGQG